MPKYSNCMPCANEGSIQIKRFTAYRQVNNANRKMRNIMVMCETLKHCWIDNKLHVIKPLTD